MALYKSKYCIVVYCMMITKGTTLTMKPTTTTTTTTITSYHYHYNYYNYNTTMMMMTTAITMVMITSTATTTIATFSFYLTNQHFFWCSVLQELFHKGTFGAPAKPLSSKSSSTKVLLVPHLSLCPPRALPQRYFWCST